VSCRWSRVRDFPLQTFQGELCDDSFGSARSHTAPCDGEVFGPALGSRVNRLIDKDSRGFACRLGGPGLGGS